MWQSGLLNAPERWSLDARFSVRGSESLGPHEGDVSVVAIDNNTLTTHSWPLPRSVYGPLIERLHSDGARLIVFDIGFNEVKAGDAALLAAARVAAPVLFAATLINPAGKYLVLGGPAVVHSVGARVGNVFVQADPDGELRHMHRSFRHVTSLPLVAAGLLGAKVKAGTFGGDGALIDYAGPAGTFPTFSFLSVLRGDVPASAFDRRVVVIGATANAIQDIHATPFGEMGGPEIVANELRTVLEGVPLRPTGELITVLLIVLMAAVPVLFAVRVGRPLVFSGASAATAAAFLIAVQVAFDAGTVVGVFPPLSALVISSAGMIVAGSVRSDRERQRLREAFAEFSTPVVEAVLGAGALDGPLPPTAVIGGYRVEAVIGRGGMAAVYRATQLALERPVALKLIAPVVASEPVYRERFLRESRLAATVEHPHVIPIYEAGDDGGLLFIAMRYVDGVDLEALLRRLGPLPPPDAVRICGQLAGALDAAHAHGLVHRDVKPANVLLDLDLEHAYLADFGIAGLAGAQGALTFQGGFIGTPNYAAPEQAFPGEIDGRADIYALGGLLFHALTGQRPYELESLAMLIAAHASAPVPTPGSLNPALAAFDPVIARAMAKRPEDRFASARDLAAAAREALGEVKASEVQ